LKTIGILGGTFDPVHKGHLQIAEQVLTRLGLDELHFLPCASPVHRDLPQAGSSDRLQMIRLAIEGHNGFGVNTTELDRGGQSYMIDTLRQIYQHGRYHSIYLILGADAFNLFRNWKFPDMILRLANLVVCARPGFELNWSNYGKQRVESVEALKHNTNGSILALNIDEISCSSSQIKRQLRSGGHVGLSECVPATVLNFITSNHLYE
jgi:nicotinate-nucleotide adenylyltransferase